MMKNLTIQARRKLAAILFRLNLNRLARPVFPALQGGTSSAYAGAWQLGAGFTVSFTVGSDTTNFSDPIGVSLPEVSVFSKDLVTLGGVTSLIGKKRNKLDMVKIRVAGYGAATLVTEPPTSGTITITWPDSTSKSATAYIVADKFQDVEPEKEMAREITFKPIAVLA